MGWVDDVDDMDVENDDEEDEMDGDEEGGVSSMVMGSISFVS